MQFPSFLLPWYAWAGLIAAAGPVLIHLLNRRRFHVVHWAAMDFLREAIQRSRRILQLRDLLLMLLRMLCLAAFGAALARPFFSSSGTVALGLNQPVHAVVLIDNSLSMGYERLDGILLDDAKAQAKGLIEKLPRGSQVSVLPTCGLPRAVRYEPYSSPDNALEALAAIRPVDRATRPDAVLDLAAEACRLSPMTPKRVVLVADEQVAAWPPEIEFIPVPVDSRENAWVADFKVRDGIADLQTPATLVATIGYDGPAPRLGVPVTLRIDDIDADTQTVDLQPGQRREVEFRPYSFNVPAERGTASYVKAEVSIPHDRLPADDQRYLVVPVVASLPVVFVDTAGRDEDPKLNRYGETYFLRRLFAPRTDRTESERQLVEVRHLKLDQLRESLADARLVVMAGVNNPGGLTTLLREYVEQGGNLVIAAGGEFNPAAWTAAAWAEGQGILPAPLKPVPVGRLPEETAGQLAPFFLDFDTLVHDYFLPPGTPPEELKAMYGPRIIFFKAVAADVGDEAERQAATGAAQYFREQRRALADLTQQQSAIRSGSPEAYNKLRADLEQKRAALQPSWLLWRSAQQDEGQRSIEELADRARPKVLGRFTNGWPFMVGRNWGQGQVLFISTSVSPGWNRLAVERQAVWVYDRILRSMLRETFPERNVSTDQRLRLPAAPALRSARFTLADSADHKQALTVDAVGGDRYEIALENRMLYGGVYRVTAQRAEDSGPSRPESRPGDVLIAVNGPADESELGSPEGGARAKPVKTGFAEAAQARAATFVAVQTTDLWKWGLAGVVAGLLLEMAVLAWFR